MPELSEQNGSPIKKICIAIAALSKPKGSSYEDILNYFVTKQPDTPFADSKQLEEYLQLAVDRDILLKQDERYMLKIFSKTDESWKIPGTSEEKSNPEVPEISYHVLGCKSEIRKSPEEIRQITDAIQEIVEAIAKLDEPDNGSPFDDIYEFLTTNMPNTSLSDPDKLKGYLQLVVDHDIIFETDGKYKLEMNSKNHEHCGIQASLEKKQNPDSSDSPHLAMEHKSKQSKGREITNPIRNILVAIAMLKEPDEGCSFDDLYEFFAIAEPNTSLSDSNQLEEYLNLGVDRDILLKTEGKYKSKMASRKGEYWRIPLPTDKKQDAKLPNAPRIFLERKSKGSSPVKSCQSNDYTRNICKAIEVLNEPDDGCSFNELYAFFQTAMPNTPLSDSKQLEEKLQLAVDSDILSKIDGRYKVNMDRKQTTAELSDISHFVSQSKSGISIIPEKIREVTYTIKEICGAIAALGENDGAPFEDIYQYFQTKEPNTSLSDSKNLEENLQVAVDSDILLKIEGRYKLNMDIAKPNLELPYISQLISEGKSEVSKSPEKFQEATFAIKEICKAIFILGENDGAPFEDIYQYFQNKQPNTPLSDSKHLEENLQVAVDCDILLEIEGRYKINMDIKKPSLDLPDISQQISEGKNEISKSLDKIQKVNFDIKEICKAIVVLGENYGVPLEAIHQHFQIKHPNTPLSDSKHLEESLQVAVDCDVLLKTEGNYKLNMEIKKPSLELADISHQISGGKGEISKSTEKMQEATFAIKEICEAIDLLGENDGTSLENIIQYFKSKQLNTPLSDSKYLEENLQIAVDCDILLKMEGRYKINMDMKKGSLELPDTPQLISEGRSTEKIQEVTFAIKEICRAIDVLGDNDGSSFEDINQYFKSKQPNTPLSHSKYLEENLQIAVDFDILLKMEGRYKLNMDIKKGSLELPDTPQPIAKGKSETSISPEKNWQDIDPIQGIVDAIALLDEPENGSSFDDIYEFFITKMPNTLLSDPDKLKEYLNLAVDCDILLKINGNYKLDMSNDDEY